MFLRAFFWSPNGPTVLSGTWKKMRKEERGKSGVECKLKAAEEHKNSGTQNQHLERPDEAERQTKFHKMEFNLGPSKQLHRDGVRGNTVQGTEFLCDALWQSKIPL